MQKQQTAAKSKQKIENTRQIQQAQREATERRRMQDERRRQLQATSSAMRVVFLRHDALCRFPSGTTLVVLECRTNLSLQT